MRSLTEADRARAEALKRQRSITGESVDTVEFSRSRSFNDSDNINARSNIEAIRGKEQALSVTAGHQTETVGSQGSHRPIVDKKVVVIGEILKYRHVF